MKILCQERKLNLYLLKPIERIKSFGVSGFIEAPLRMRRPVFIATEKVSMLRFLIWLSDFTLRSVPPRPHHQSKQRENKATSSAWKKSLSILMIRASIAYTAKSRSLRRERDSGTVPPAMSNFEL